MSGLQTRFSPSVLLSLFFLFLLFLFPAPGTCGELQRPFHEEASLRGIHYIPRALMDGAAVTPADLDSDGDPDLVMVGQIDGLVGVWENDGRGFFRDRAPTSGIPVLTEGSSAVTIDYDRDGDLDLFIARYGRPDALLRNDSGFRFTDVTAAAGVAGGDDYGTGASVGDYDGDGWLDLYVANGGTANRLFRNLGDGTFEDLAADLGVDQPMDLTWQSSFFDYDRDGDVDLYLATDRGTQCETLGFRNHLFENVGASFVDVTDASGTEACLDAMCIAFGDVDRNGYTDIYCTNTPSGNALMLNDGNGAFRRAENEYGVASYEIGWGSVFFDYDNDSDLDLYVCIMGERNQLFQNGPILPMRNVAGRMNVDVPGISYVVATADIDLDGDLDLFVQNIREPVRLFVNGEGSRRNWVKLDVIGEGENWHGVGATVDIVAGDYTDCRDVVAGCGFKNHNELVLHFGLGSREVVDEIKVTWPGGTTRTFTNYRAGRSWYLYPPDKLGDFDFDGDRDFDDFRAFRIAFSFPKVRPGVEMMDHDGDGDVDMNDFGAFFATYTGPLDDCNGNGILDLIEVLADPRSDRNRNAIPDTCEQAGSTPSRLPGMENRYRPPRR